MSELPVSGAPKRLFGLIGYPLGHSFSQKYFTDKFRKEGHSDYEFRNFPIEDVRTVKELVKNNPLLCGLSVTIPHKEAVMKYLDEVKGEAKEIGAVNCIRIDRNAGKLYGYNTDATGFKGSLAPLLKPHHSRALILGTGGASKAIASVLNKSKIIFRYVSRNGNVPGRKNAFLRYSDLDKEIIYSHTLIINTTPLGMFPKTDECPDIPYDSITSKHLLYDLIYNPQETLFLKRGKEKGAQVKNGLEMLHIQAEEAWKIWTNPLPFP